MAYTYSKIATYTVGSGGISTINFTNIPQTYTDLKLVISARNSANNDGFYLTFNGSSTGYSYKEIYASSSTIASDGSTSSAYLVNYGGMNASIATASAFASAEIYIPNYTSSNYKSVSADGFDEANTTVNYMYISANLWSNTSPITSITLTAGSSGTAVQYSSAHLYGIKAEV
jgi:hypothetical protein